MKRRDVLRLTGAGLAAGALYAPGLGTAFAQSKMVLKATDVHPLGYPTVEAVERMGKKLEAATNGRLSIQMYPSMQLGGEKEMIEQAQVGALAIARISVGPMGPLVPELNVFNLPFMFRDNAHMEKVIDGEIGQEMLKKLSDHPTAGLIGLCWMNGGTPQRLQLEEADQVGRRPQGSQDPHDGQSGVRRHHELARRQRRRHGLRPAHQRHADRRRRRGGEQRAELHDRPALPLRQVLLDDRAPDDPRDPGVLEADLRSRSPRKTRT